MNIVKSWPEQITSVDQLKASADVIEQVSDTVTYLGFRNPIPGDVMPDWDSPIWSIMKIEQSGNVYPILTTFTWMNGSMNFDQKWSERGNYQYYFRGNNL